MNTQTFTRTAAQLVAANDRATRRAARRRRLRQILLGRIRAAAVLWSALALAAVVLSWSVVPVNVHG